MAVVHWGTTDRQQVVRTDLAHLADVDLPAPAAIVIGAVAALDVTAAVPRPRRPELSVHDHGAAPPPAGTSRPATGSLVGRTVVVTRARAQASELVRAAGADSGPPWSSCR